MTVYIILTMMLMSVYLVGFMTEVVCEFQDLTWADYALATAVAALWSFGLALIWPL